MDGPVRLGNTCRRPARPNSLFVQRLLGQLDRAGVSWTPRPLGFDSDGRELLTWIDGDSVSSVADIDLPELVRFVRELHDLTAGTVEDAECVIHDDLQPRNVIVCGRIPVGIVDWEQARPGARVEDVAKLCWAFLEPSPTSDPSELGRQWRRIVDMYELEPRHELVPVAIDSMAACVDDIERQAAAGSMRHRLLADRGDHLTLRRMLSWTRDNRAVLERAISPHA